MILLHPICNKTESACSGDLAGMNCDLLLSKPKQFKSIQLDFNETKKLVLSYFIGSTFNKGV